MKTIKTAKKEADQWLGSSLEFDVNTNNNDLEIIGRFALNDTSGIRTTI